MTRATNRPAGCAQQVGAAGLHGATDASIAARNSYGEIVRSSAVIGGASVAVLFVGIVRSKALALLLGPAGFGLMGVYLSLVDVVRAVAGMGVSNGGVRQIAESVGSGDDARIAATAAAVRRVTTVLALLALVGTAALSIPLSLLTFGDDSHAWAITMIALAVALKLVADSESAVVQGTRRLGDLARINVVGALVGTVAAIPIVYWLGEDGVVPAVVVLCAAAAAASWWYGRRARPFSPRCAAAPSPTQIRPLLRLSVVFMASGLLMMGAAYAVRVMVLKVSGVEAAGFYQAAWTLGGMYVGFVLQAMGTDFYPRLVAVASDRERCRALVNEQAEVSLLLAGPGVLATIALAPIALTVFYSSAFVTAVDVLRWICAGMALRVVTWPMGFIIVAQSRQMAFFATELAWTAINVTLSWLCLLEWGVAGVGIAFFLSYVTHAAMIYPLVRAYSGFRWSHINGRLSLAFGALVVLVLAANALLPALEAMMFGGVVTVATTAWSLRALLRLLGSGCIPERWKSLLLRLHVSTPRL